MQQMRLDSKDGLANGWMGAGAGVADARNLPEHVRAKAPKAGGAEQSADERPKRGWLGTTFRFARNALAGLLLLTAVPVTFVGWRSQHLRYYEYTSTRSRIDRAERLRPYMMPKDVSITPMQAGLAFHELQQTPSDQSEQFPTVSAEAAPVWPWRTNKLADGMFAAAGPRSRAFEGAPPEHIIEIVPGGFSPAELAWLRDVAEAPMWKHFDRVAAAQAVDIVGGHYKLPFKSDAFAPSMPLVRFAATKELAYAGMSRAAYYLAIGEPAKSEAAVRSVIAFGFALIDNATNLMDALIGGVIVNIGGNGLEQFNLATHSNSTLAADAPQGILSTPNTTGRGLPVSADELRKRLLTEAADESAPRGIRMEQLNQLSFASCTNVSEMIFGPSTETKAAFASAKSLLARFPSEAALLDLMEDATNRVPEKDVITSGPERLLMGAAVIASTITNNPRITACTRIATVFR